MLVKTTNTITNVRSFPDHTTLASYQPKWSKSFTKEVKRLYFIIDQIIYRTNHIGSTSVPGMLANPIIDILLEVGRNCDLEDLTYAMSMAGYQLKQLQGNPELDLMYSKDIKEIGAKGQQFHIYIRYPGDWDEYYFCEFLRRHPEMQRQYEQLRLELGQRFMNNPEVYANGKSEFVQKVTTLARQEFPSKFATNVGRFFEQR